MIALIISFVVIGLALLGGYMFYRFYNNNHRIVEMKSLQSLPNINNIELQQQLQQNCRRDNLAATVTYGTDCKKKIKEFCDNPKHKSTYFCTSYNTESKSYNDRSPVFRGGKNKNRK